MQKVCILYNALGLQTITISLLTFLYKILFRDDKSKKLDKEKISISKVKTSILITLIKN